MCKEIDEFECVQSAKCHPRRRCWLFFGVPSDKLILHSVPNCTNWRQAFIRYVNLGYFKIMEADINLCLVAVINESTSGVLDSISCTDLSKYPLEFSKWRTSLAAGENLQCSHFHVTDRFGKHDPSHIHQLVI
jgi:hypothetical protein